MITSSNLVGHVSHFSVVYLFVWLLTLGYWNGLASCRYCVISRCQGLARLACVEAVFPTTIWNGFFGRGSVSKICLCEDCWQPNNCLYYVCFLLFFFLCCFICILFFCVNLWGQWLKWQLRPSLPVPVFLIKCFVLSRDAEINWTELN